MTIATFSALVDDPRSQKDFLVIATPKIRLQEWTKTGGYTNVYEKAFANIFEASTDYGNTYRDVDSVEHNGTALTERASIALVDANSGSYFHDEANSKLYVHLTDSTSPNFASKWIVVFVNLYFASGVGKNGKGKIFSDIYYEPLFAPENIPSLKFEQTDIFAGGGIPIDSGVLEFLNTRSFFDKMFDDYSWQNAVVKVYFGGESLPFNEYALIYYCSIRQKFWTERKITFETVNFFDILKRNVPVNPCFGADVSPQDRGKPLPLCFGEVSSIRPLCTDDSDPANKEYTIADADYQTLKAIDAVYDGTTDVTASVTKDLTNCKFTFNAYTPSGEVTCDVKGAKISDISGEASTDLMTNASDIIRFFLKEILEFDDTYIDSASFADAKADNDFKLCKYIRMRRNLSSYIAEVERSVLGVFSFKNGKFYFDVFSSASATEDDELRDEDMGNFTSRRPIAKTFIGIQVYFNPIPHERDEASSIVEGEDDTYEVVEDTHDQPKYLDKRKLAFKRFYTWIKEQSHAETLLGRLLLFTSAVIKEIEIEVKGIKMFNRFPSDILKIYRTKAPTASGQLDGEKFQINKIEKEITENRSIINVDNIKTVAINVGEWTDASAPNWSGATEEQRRDQGFWSASDGCVVAGDMDTYNKSVWW